MYKVLIALPLTLVLLGCQVNHHNTGAIANCEETLMKYPQYRDKGPIKSYQSLFTPDAIFSVPKFNIALKGSDAISARVETALMNKKSIHMITGMNVYPTGSDTFTNRSHFILYRQDKNDETAPTHIYNGRYEDELIIKSNQCYIKTRHVLIDRVDVL
ncbi:nuclear transport factor 2 family protein [Pseudoalteromonas aurantia]|uniref:SnoaL-like domain-containing protein n=1 Tax=Pseudoalteromonas aurantia TaxID=43654 RepID=A0A5S3VC49_9GAMM|nr:nuclear transport factor 2 family protein [Pseudoalteromonas aurantia]TMO60422.1 hypothetical protein CWC18_13485 [Pseudoalteromonas aurantia]TMO69110.1 hypothetical protein CWC19_06665 [Pseudoalteromonas aurantia]TMO79101.1 hypothetical protein CWC20_00345 [Pseudoalteromonas aurantia]